MDRMAIWRRAYADECKKINEYAKASFHKKKMSAIINGGIIEFVMIWFVLLVGGMSVEGKPQSSLIMNSVLIFIVSTIVIVGGCILFVWPSKRRVKFIDEQRFQVAEASVIDRKRIVGRSIERGSYVTVKCESYEKSETRELRVFDEIYDDMALGKEVLLVRYNEDTYIEGFFDTYDVVIR